MSDVLDKWLDETDSDCPEGWYPILATLFDDCLALGMTVEDFDHCKMKYGSLVLSMNRVPSDEVQKLLEDAVNKCDSSCELCGKPAQLTIFHGWLETVCEEHRRGEPTTADKHYMTFTKKIDG